MTPEKARELLDGTVPGPWEVEEFEEQYAGCPPTTKFYLGSDDFQNIATAETTERYYDQTRANFALIAAAPALAETVAGLKVEYAVQMLKDDWVPLSGFFPTLEQARAFRESKQELAPTRIVRRLVGDQEVVE